MHELSDIPVAVFLQEFLVLTILVRPQICVAPWGIALNSVTTILYEDDLLSTASDDTRKTAGCKHFKLHSSKRMQGFQGKTQPVRRISQLLNLHLAPGYLDLPPL